jgi:hypothetical protein
MMVPLFIIGVVVPIAFVFVGGAIKLIPHQRFEVRELFLGTDFSIAGMVSAAALFLDLGKRMLETNLAVERGFILLLWTFFFFLAGLFLTLAFMLGQLFGVERYKRMTPPQQEPVRFGLSASTRFAIISDAVGSVYLIIFLLFALLIGWGK